MKCNLSISGHPEGPVRLALIEEAIALIQKDPEGALREERLGVKNYARFGDQRSDHPYGMGPRHGAIVFSIGREDVNKPLGQDDIAALLAVRDAGKVTVPRGRRDHRGVDVPLSTNLLHAQRVLAKAQRRVDEMRAAIEEAKA